MAVPAHDSRDHEFALKYDIPIVRVVIGTDKNRHNREPYVDDGITINSSNSSSGLDINSLSCKDAAAKVINWLEITGYGKKKVSLPFPFLPDFRLWAVYIYIYIFHFSFH